MKFRGYSSLPSPVLLWSAFYLVSLRYSMQIRLKGKRWKPGEKLLFHHSKVRTFFLHPSFFQFSYSIDLLTVYQSFCLSVCPSVRPSVRPSVHQSVRSSHIHQIHGKSWEFLITPPCQSYMRAHRWPYCPYTVHTGTYRYGFSEGSCSNTIMIKQKKMKACNLVFVEYCGNSFLDQLCKVKNNVIVTIHSFTTSFI